jgi:hypothetical protein
VEFEQRKKVRDLLSLKVNLNLDQETKINQNIEQISEDKQTSGG